MARNPARSGARAASPLGIALLAAVTAGCGLEAPKDERTAAPAPAVRAEPELASIIPTHVLRGGDPLRDCAPAAPGATTHIDDVRGGVALTITAREPAATQEIRRRAKARSDSAGTCPVITYDTTLAVAEVAGGARIVIRPRAGSLADLRAEIRRRWVELP
jgi:hypothetical protein